MVIYIKVLFLQREKSFSYVFEGSLEEVTEFFTSAVQTRATVVLKPSDTGRIILDMSKAIRVAVTSDSEESALGPITANEDKPTLTLDNVSMIRH